MIDTIITSQIFLLTLTVGVYYGAQRLYGRLRFAILNPVLLCMVTIIAFLRLMGIPFETYYRANELINFLLGVSVVALGYLLHTNIEHIRSEKFSILFAIFIGSVIGVASVVGMAWLMGVDGAIAASLQPKSVTTPIALALSERIGGIPALTSVAVMVVGIFGSIVGPWLLDAIGVSSPVARGLALGAGAHAVGTARAMEMGAIEGAISGAAIGLMGVMTAVVIPLIDRLLAIL